MHRKQAHKRKNIRYEVTTSMVAEISLGLSKERAVTHKALVITESYRGCSIVVALAPELAVGERVRAKVGDLSEMLAEVRWVVPLDDQVQKVGLMYLE